MISTVIEDAREIAAPASEHHNPGSTDFGELFRLVAMRNNRLQRLIALNAPGIVVRNEQRMLRAAMDAVIAQGGIGDKTTHDAGGASADHVHRSAAVSRRGSPLAVPQEIRRPRLPNGLMGETAA